MNELKQLNIGFIGVGNMATAMIAGLLKNGMPPQNLYVYPVREQAKAFWQGKGVQIAPDLPTLTRQATLIIIAVKPQKFDEASDGLGHLGSDKTVLSVMAGIPVQRIQKNCGVASVIRTMPNTPALIAQGATGVYYSAQVSDLMRRAVPALLDCLGPVVVEVPQETMLDAITAVSGSAPAYYFAFMEAQIKTAMSMGFTQKQATDLVIQAALGAAQLAKESEHSLSVLRQQVTSPGGTTEQALIQLAEKGLAETVDSAMRAAQSRAQTLAN